MDGLYSFLLAFSLTLVEVINTLLIGYTGVVFFREFASLYHASFFSTCFCFSLIVCNAFNLLLREQRYEIILKDNPPDEE